MTFALVIALVAGAGAVMAALTGAGIGSTLVPLFAMRADFKVAVAAATLPHLVGSAMRAVELWKHVDRRLLVRFGLLCAAASLAGALAHTRINSPAIAYAFAALLIRAGLLGLLGVADKARLPGSAGWAAGGASGFLGGLAGEQGGLRAVALLRFDLPKDVFVATSTATAVVVDAARAPVYLVTQWSSVRQMVGLIGLAVAGVVAGTLLGRTLRDRIPEALFRRVVSGVILVIGGLLLLRGRG